MLEKAKLRRGEGEGLLTLQCLPGWGWEDYCTDESAAESAWTRLVLDGEGVSMYSTCDTWDEHVCATRKVEGGRRKEQFGFRPRRCWFVQLINYCWWRVRRVLYIHRDLQNQVIVKNSVIEYYFIPPKIYTPLRLITLHHPLPKICACDHKKLHFPLLS